MRVFERQPPRGLGQLPLVAVIYDCCLDSPLCAPVFADAVCILRRQLHRSQAVFCLWNPVAGESGSDIRQSLSSTYRSDQQERE